MIEEARTRVLSTYNNNKVKTIATTNEYQRIVEIAVELVTSGRYCRRNGCCSAVDGIAKGYPIVDIVVEINLKIQLLQ